MHVITHHIMHTAGKGASKGPVTTTLGVLAGAAFIVGTGGVGLAALGAGAALGGIAGGCAGNLTKV